MEITYTDEKGFAKEQVQQLFRSVGWVSGEYPERLHKALMGSSTVFSAWDGDRLVGLVRVLDDTEMVAYMHYVLVDPEYQGHGIAGHLVGMVKEKYCDYLFILKSCRKKARTPPSIRSTASQSWKTAWPCRSAIRENAAETSIVTPTILLPPSNGGGIAFSSIRQYIGGLGGAFGHFRTPYVVFFQQVLPYIGEMSPVKFTNLPYVARIRA